MGDLQALVPLKRQLNIRHPKLDKVLYGFGLFICNGNTFYSPKLNEVMNPFEDRRARIEAYKHNKKKHKSLETSNVNAEKGDIVSFEVKVKGKGKVTTSKEEKKGDGDAASVSVPTTLAWERYIDELLQGKQWIEVTAMRSGLGLVFVNPFLSKGAERRICTHPL